MMFRRKKRSQHFRRSPVLPNAPSSPLTIMRKELNFALSFSSLFTSLSIFAWILFFTHKNWMLECERNSAKNVIQNSILTQPWDLLVRRILMHNSTRRLRNFWFNFHISPPSLQFTSRRICSCCHFRWIIPCKFETLNMRRHQRERNVNCLSFTIDSYSWSRVSSLILLYHRIKFEMFGWEGTTHREKESAQLMEKHQTNYETRLNVSGSSHSSNGVSCAYLWERNPDGDPTTTRWCDVEDSLREFENITKRCRVNWYGRYTIMGNWNLCSAHFIHFTYMYRQKCYHTSLWFWHTTRYNFTVGEWCLLQRLKWKKNEVWQHLFQKVSIFHKTHEIDAKWKWINFFVSELHCLILMDESLSLQHINFIADVQRVLRGSSGIVEFAVLNYRNSK